MIVSVTFRNIKLTVQGRHSPGFKGSWDEPPEAEEFEVQSALTPHGDDISEILTDYFAEFETLCLAAVHDQLEGEKAEHEDYLRQERRAG